METKSPEVPITPDTRGLNLFPKNPIRMNRKSGIRTIQIV
jgi:hypothetical protein